MKKDKIPEEILDEYFFDDGSDYKMSQLIHDSRENYASVGNWLYLGADNRNPKFAKVGITGGDLSSRSYSSASPGYYLFCAFKFKYNIPKSVMESVEADVLNRLDEYWCNESNGAERLFHYESNVLSECFDGVDFLEFYKDLHYLIYTHHRDKFQISGYEENEFDEGNLEFVVCIFNKRLPKKDREYIEMILQ
ncbi:hypothetical protein [Acinetobacter sp.]|uniref:hypothetical protein n=1 Tax=Acinetobacter sp. TaxID=472 RepID=UPI00248816E5|nr:hypothetical protein [Acinetobacter sp.]MDI1222985.1 hypothetical protein [Acinetobacter sp.]